ncbi:MAG: S8 family serine peptidase [Gaiellaceae bacterium]
MEPAPIPGPLGLVDSSNAVGAPSFWSAGHTGGSGAADTIPVNLAIENDKIQEDHPAFAGLTFQRPPDVGIGTSCGSGAGSCDHGTAVASLAISRGASGCPICVGADANQKGVAPGLRTVLDADADGTHEPLHFDVFTWELGLPSGGVSGTTYPANVFSDSHGVTNITVDDNVDSRAEDATLSEYGGSRAEPAGNDGPTSQTLVDSCIAYDVLCMGAFDKGSNFTDASDDTMASYSSRGPTIGGRKKPDLVAVGSAAYADRLWWIHNTLWSGGLSGTSFAAPQGAGAAALLLGSGITDPLAQKAILIESARPGRATPASAMGTQTTWQPDWGWGELDLSRALAERTSFATATVPSYGVRFYRASTAAGDRATLVWNRRGSMCLTTGCQVNLLTLSNLDLQQVDAATGSLQAQSNSSIDNVEQVRSPGAGQVIYKVRATSNVDGLSGEPFALAATNSPTALANPQPTPSLQLSTAQLKPGQTATVTATAHNPSSDLTAESAQLTLNVPTGVQIITGSQTQTLGTLATNGSSGDSDTATWTIRATGDVAGHITATATASRYGETFSSSATSPVIVDGTAPSPTVAAPTGSTADARLPVSWAATDGISGVDHYDVEVSADGAAFSPWLTRTTATSGSYAGEPGHGYAFRVRAVDGMGNLSPYVTSGTIQVLQAAKPSPPPANPGHPAPPSAPGGASSPTSPILRLSAPKRTRGRIVVTGKVARAATGPVSVVYSVKAGRRTYRLRGRATPAHGGFKVVLRATPAALRSARAILVATYAGGGRFRRQTARLTVHYAR